MVMRSSLQQRYKIKFYRYYSHYYLYFPSIYDKNTPEGRAIRGLDDNVYKHEDREECEDMVRKMDSSLFESIKGRLNADSWRILLDEIVKINSQDESRCLKILSAVRQNDMEHIKTLYGKDISPFFSKYPILSGLLDILGDPNIVIPLYIISGRTEHIPKDFIFSVDYIDAIQDNNTCNFLYDNFSQVCNIIEPKNLGQLLWWLKDPNVEPKDVIMNFVDDVRCLKHILRDTRISTFIWMPILLKKASENNYFKSVDFLLHHNQLPYKCIKGCLISAIQYISAESTKVFLNFLKNHTNHHIIIEATKRLNKKNFLDILSKDPYLTRKEKFEMIFNNRIRILDMILNNPSLDLKVKQYAGLINAVECDDDMASIYLNHLSVSTIKNGYKIISVAVSHGSKEIIEKLIHHCALTSREIEDIISRGILRNKTKILDSILNRYSNIKYVMFALEEARKLNSTFIVNYLVEKFSFLKINNDEGCIAHPTYQHPIRMIIDFINMAKKGQITGVRDILLNSHVNVESGYYRALRLANKNGHERIVDLILSHMS